jgi:hypothetical protein
MQEINCILCRILYGYRDESRKVVHLVVVDGDRKTP